MIKTYVNIANYVERGQSSKSEEASAKTDPNKISKRDSARNTRRVAATADDDSDASRKYEETKKASKKRKSEWYEKCLNLNCDEKHRIKDCEIISEEDKKRSLKEFYDGVKKAKFSAIRRSHLGDGRWKALLDDSYDYVALEDYGADDSALPMKLLNQTKDNGSVVKMEHLKTPINLTPAIKLQQEVVTASTKCRLNNTVCLPCGPLRLRSVKFHFIDKDMNEVLHGRPQLKCLRFNLKSHFWSVRSKFDGVEMSKIMEQRLYGENTHKSDKPKSFSISSFRGLWQDCVEDGAVYLLESIGNSTGTDKEEDIQKAFNTVMDESHKNRMTEQGIIKTKFMLKTYRDIFQFNLWPDPPALVVPMQVQLKENHRPVWAKQRRYAPKQYAFIANTIHNLVSIGAVERNPGVRCASPALAVPKPGYQNFRFKRLWELRSKNTNLWLFSPVLSRFHVEIRVSLKKRRSLLLSQ